MLYNVKAGIIGLDELGIKYADLLKDHVKNISLIAASGRTQKELLYAKNTLSLEYVYGDEKQLIENHDVDALFIFSDTHLRANLAIQAIEKGKHVYMVNPIALNLDDAKAVYKTADSHPSQTVMCASPIRANSVLNRLKEVIADELLGEIQLFEISSNFIQSINKKYANASGSKYLDRLLDEIDLCNWLFGASYKNVEITKKKALKLCDVSTDSELSLRFLARFDSNSDYGMLKIEGSKATVLLNNLERDHIDIHMTDGSWKRINVNHSDRIPHAEYQQLVHFTNCILGKEKNSLGLDHAVRSMELALAFEKSDVLGQPVELDNS